MIYIDIWKFIYIIKICILLLSDLVYIQDANPAFYLFFIICYVN